MPQTLSRERLDDALYAWAASERKELEGLGYPKMAVFAKDHVSGYRTTVVPGLGDVDLLSLVERGIARLKVDSPTQYWTLVAHYHADAAYPDSRDARVRAYTKAWGMSRSTFAKHLKDARRYLQGIVDMYCE